MAEEEGCSFCGKPPLSVLHLFLGPAGCNICDACVTTELQAPPTAVEADKCGFCGRNVEEVTVAMESLDSANCADCLVNFREQVKQLLGDQSEFLSGGTSEEDVATAAELRDMALEFTKHFEKFATGFGAKEIDWAAHNDMAQLLHPMRGKAGRIGNDELLDIIWKIDQFFGKIRFDDLDANAPIVRELVDLVDRLVAVSRRTAGV